MPSDSNCVHGVPAPLGSGNTQDGDQERAEPRALCSPSGPALRPPTSGLCPPLSLSPYLLSTRTVSQNLTGNRPTFPGSGSFLFVLCMMGPQIYLYSLAPSPLRVLDSHPSIFLCIWITIQEDSRDFFPLSRSYYETLIISF